MKIRNSVVLLLLVLSSRAAFGCINDRDSDTLAQQGQELPDVVRVITGRFERNPPLYFQMRIARVQKELRQNPANLPLYDDIAVAYDRLGEDNDAISWMNRKKIQLAKSSTRSAEKTEATYRYYANNGTFWAHRWLRAGANRAKINQIKTARNFIAQAIKIKPNAHFGREKYQLMIMDWIVNPYKNGTKGKPAVQPLTNFINNADSLTSEDSIDGLSGIIVLGSAWESVDIFHALSGALENNSKSTLQYLAILRCRELIESGKKSLRPDSKSGDELQVQLRIDTAGLNAGRIGLRIDDTPLPIMLQEQNQTAIQTVYNRLRAEAETWQKKRTEYMMTRLKAGKHPDTDKTFWKDWRDTEPLSLDVAWYSERAENRRSSSLKQNAVFFFTFVPLSLALIATLWVLRRKRLRA